MSSDVSNTVVLATGNPGKLAEMRQLMAEYGWQVVAQSDFEVPEAAETGLTFVENALIKARNAARHTGLPAIADDSGLAVDALDGAPGIYSARYAGPRASDSENNQKLLEALSTIPQSSRTARYHCVLAFLRSENDPVPLICDGHWEGRIGDTPSGDGGFGYDPLFRPIETRGTAAELDPDTKNRLSHRGKAMAELRRLLQDRGAQ